MAPLAAEEEMSTKETGICISLARSDGNKILNLAFKLLDITNVCPFTIVS